MKTLIGENSLVAIEGEHWKRIRKMFNPAFAPSHLETMIPYIIEESNVFVDKLNQVAQTGETVRMTELIMV
jgi:cytochrome P450